MVSSGIYEIAWWFSALPLSTWPCITENAASAFFLCLENNCGKGYHQQVRARGSATLPYRSSLINSWAGKYTSLISAPIVLT